MARHNQNQNQNQNQNHNRNQNQNQNRNQNQNQNRSQNANGNNEEDFTLRETTPSLGGGRVPGNDRIITSFDLVEQMHYLYVRVVKAKELPPKQGDDNPTFLPDPYVEVKLGSFKGLTKHFENQSNPEWNQVFAFLRERIQSQVVEVIVKDKDNSDGRNDFIGGVAFEINEVPCRVPPDSPLAPQWYRLENQGGERARGELMLAVWMGTQADEAFPDAWHLDALSVSGDGITSIRSKVYLSPRLWYLRVNVIEAQELEIHGDRNRQHQDLFVKAAFGNLVLRTKSSATRNANPVWNEDLMFVVAEPFEEPVILSVEDRVAANKVEVLGKCCVFLQNVDKRMDDKPPRGRWYPLEKIVTGEDGQVSVVQLNSRLHLRVCLEGGYHVLDELTQYSSDLRATARQLGSPSIGVLELGILNAQGLAPMKTRNGRGTTDAYCVAKYGQKWIRTRTITETLNPKWNEQYTWEVFDPCTVITIGVFDNSHLQGVDDGNGRKDLKIGKVRIRLSTLETDRVYTHLYPLIVLQPSGVKKMGGIQLAVRFTSSSWLNLLLMYKQPMLPKMHYLRPLTSFQQDNLRQQATQIVSTRMSRAEPPLRKEVVEYMLDVGSLMWSVRKTKAIHSRFQQVFSGLNAFLVSFSDVCHWKSPVKTVLAHVVFLVLVFCPRLILSSFFFSLFMLGIWKYGSRPRHPPHMDIKLSCADEAHVDELEEEFDTFPTSKQGDGLKMRYDRLRSISARLQNFTGDLVTQGERFHNLLTWRDPRATGMFLVFCFVAGMVLFVVPFQLIVVCVGFFVMRHPGARNKLPSVPINFFKRLPARTDGLL